MNSRRILPLIVTVLAFMGDHRCAWALGDETPSLLNASLRMTWGLLVVLAVLLIIYVIVKKRLAPMQGRSKGRINVIETRHLMPKKSLFLVEVRGREYLLGAGSDSLELIARIDGDQPGRSFQQILSDTESKNTQ
ncbi:flagellar biosynthetic protein FliO [Desulfofustis glycolicus]|uniref:Flagellar protein FliO/FliZ n=1 Tax=Desulfofustis glycolicus DSM 9705 TaxID=1121409 RepID=A0A1M5U1C3_9BACT|nr:flagellar biosynthetic protein FliO [Desulfofustis glycolicus]SHH56758.1 flagellar protein FliO/FliZ [Desulfofustis glycolicus DSM 9705]